MKRVVLMLVLALLLVPAAAMADVLTFTAINGGAWAGAPAPSSTFSATTNAGINVSLNGVLAGTDPASWIQFTTGTSGASCSASNCTFGSGGSIYVTDGTNTYFLGSFTGSSLIQLSGLTGYQFTGNFIGGQVDSTIATALGWPSNNVTGQMQFAFSANGTITRAGLDVQPTPEPASLALLGSGFLALGGLVRRKIRR